MNEAHNHTAVCACGHEKFSTLESRPRSIHGVMCVVRRKQCRSCLRSITTAEVPLSVAKDVWNEE
ncbi:hypothetical protein [Gemmobacter caeni]|uniref:hypothetical protein n=1 Tax=Gemmobacter caeni TaxID=589035 RepID=UPI0011AA345F|nr:hypothetical protein [Gemmobacter caeni]